MHPVLAFVCGMNCCAWLWTAGHTCLVVWVNLSNPERRTGMPSWQIWGLRADLEFSCVWQPKQNINRFHLTGLVIFGSKTAGGEKDRGSETQWAKLTTLTNVWIKIVWMAHRGFVAESWLCSQSHILFLEMTHLPLCRDDWKLSEKKNYTALKIWKISSTGKHVS